MLQKQGISYKTRNAGIYIQRGGDMEQVMKLTRNEEPMAIFFHI